MISAFQLNFNIVVICPQRDSAVCKITIIFLIDPDMLFNNVDISLFKFKSLVIIYISIRIGIVRYCKTNVSIFDIIGDV